MDECDIDPFGCHPSVHQYHASMEKSWMSYIQPKECKEDECMNMKKLGKIITKGIIVFPRIVIHLVSHLSILIEP
jgi:hypothetical protein